MMANTQSGKLKQNIFFDDKITGLQRWLLDTSIELDITDKTHLSAIYKRISDSNYFTDISRTNSEKTLKSNLKLSFNDPSTNLKAHILTEHEQTVYCRTRISKSSRDFIF